MENIDELLQSVAAEVDKLKDEHPEAIQRTYGKDTHKGYDTTGYNLPWIWEILIGHVGPSRVQVHYDDLEVEEQTTSKGRRQYQVSLRATVRIIDGGEIVAECSAFGGHVAFLRGDALKGGETNAVKKALSYWGIGLRAFKGIIDADYDPLPEGYSEPPQEKPHQYRLVMNFIRAARVIGPDNDPGLAYREYLSNIAPEKLKMFAELDQGVALINPMPDSKLKKLEAALAQLYEDNPGTAEKVKAMEDADENQF